MVPVSRKERGDVMKQYRALISLPIQAASDDEAIDIANEQAASVRHPRGGVVGHVELVGEVRDDHLEVSRVVSADPMFLRQLPPDWKP